VALLNWRDIASMRGVLYVADTLNHHIRSIGTDGTITTLAGTGARGHGGDGGPRLCTAGCAFAPRPMIALRQ
jgi:hypothetical protein